ncbi:MAG: hypothetical protein AAF585_24245 [Verrucomicrobiota bacterium]
MNTMRDAMVRVKDNTNQAPPPKPGILTVTTSGGLFLAFSRATGSFLKNLRIRRGR